MAQSKSNNQLGQAYALLFVPAIKEKFYSRAVHESKRIAGVVLDLEDSVAASSKAKARDLFLEKGPELANAIGMGKCWIRINNRNTKHFNDDLKLISKLSTRGIYPSVMYPKYTSPGDIKRIHALFQKPDQRIFVNIENFRAVEDLDRLLDKKLPIHAAVFGAEDISAELGVDRPGNFYSNPLFSHLAARIACKCHANKIQFWGNIWPFHQNGIYTEQFRDETFADHDLGAVGKIVYTPDQINRVNAIFSQRAEKPDDICKRLEALLRAFRKNGSLVTLHNSKMIDAPELVRARRLHTLNHDPRLKSLLHQLERTVS